MVDSVIQTSFHAGELAPALYARVDLAKYHSAAALMENFYVDYRGGASTRPGTKYVIQAAKSDKAVRLIPFQASIDVGYILEFGDFYIRFHRQAFPITVSGVSITGCINNTITAIGNTFGIGDWIYVHDVGGVTNINGRYFVVTSVGNTFSVADLFGNLPNFTGYTSGGEADKIYTIATPYAAADLAELKFAQSVDKLYLCHPNHPPAILQIITANSWSLTSINFGATISSPITVTANTTNGGSGHYTYIVTAVDARGQESPPLGSASSTINTTSGQIATINIAWSLVTGAIFYNIYRTPLRMDADPPVGSAFGFVMSVTGTAAADTFTSNTPHNAADYSLSPPIPRNPFQGAGVAYVIVTGSGSYTTVPTVTFDTAPSGGFTATGQVVLGMVGLTIVSSSGGLSVEEILGCETFPVSIMVTEIDGTGHATAIVIADPGSISSGNTPTNNLIFGTVLHYVEVTVDWGVTNVNVISEGAGYTSVPAVTFSGGTASAAAVLQDSSAGNPTVPALFQQRLVLAAKPSAVQTFNMSQPGSYTNFNISNPIQPDDAIEASIVSNQLNKIQSMIPVPTGLMVLTSSSNWLVQGNSGSAVSPIDIHADAHSYNGASSLPPIIANYDILFVQEKGSIVRDLAFNFYTQIYTGADISILSSHLFYGYTIQEWAWAEEPFKVIWAVRNDGIALTCTFLKEQELIGWAHSNTDGLFKSVATITEATATGLVDAIYFVVERVINGFTVKYIERLADRFVASGASLAWCVDAGIQYNGAPISAFSGAEHLGGKTVVGVADGQPIVPFVMPYSGTFNFSTPKSIVTIGLAYEPRLKTLPLDISGPTIQGKRKGINGVTVRVQDTLGLAIGKDFSVTVPMKDLIVGKVGSASNQVVTDLVTCDARTIIDPSWDVPGQYCIKQPQPLPATILGVIPEIEVGDK